MKLRVGTSGFAYKEWKGSFYPETIKPDAMHTYILTLFDENYMYKVHRIR